MPQRRAPKLQDKMSGVVPREIINLLRRVGGRFSHRPARDVALWLSLVPLLLPGHVIAGTIAVAKRNHGDTDPRWSLVLSISAANFILSFIALIWLYYLLGEWVLDRLNDLLGPFFLWPSDSGSSAVPV